MDGEYSLIDIDASTNLSKISIRNEDDRSLIQNTTTPLNSEKDTLFNDTQGNVIERAMFMIETLIHFIEHVHIWIAT